jgi:hypothetical protein
MVSKSVLDAAFAKAESDDLTLQYEKRTKCDALAPVDLVGPSLLAK